MRAFRPLDLERLIEGFALEQPPAKVSLAKCLGEPQRHRHAGAGAEIDGVN